MITPEDAKARAVATYNAAADFYDDAANSFWDRFGRRTIERLRLQPGARVLDVCCGSGASAIPAAEEVGRNGFVLGIDPAQGLLDPAWKKARDRGLQTIECRMGDMLDLGLPGSAFDAVVRAFGIFFVPDMPAAIRALWRVVRPGGQLAITTWGPRFFEPATTAFWNAVRDVRPDLYDPPALRRLLAYRGRSSSSTRRLASASARPTSVGRGQRRVCPRPETLSRAVHLRGRRAGPPA